MFILPELLAISDVVASEELGVVENGALFKTVFVTTDDTFLVVSGSGLRINAMYGGTVHMVYLPGSIVRGYIKIVQLVDQRGFVSIVNSFGNIDSLRHSPFGGCSFGSRIQR